MKNLKNKIKKIIYIVIVFIPLLKCTSKPILKKLKKYRKSEKEQYREHLKKINQVKLEVPNKHKILIKFTTKSGKILERPMYLQCNKHNHGFPDIKIEIEEENKLYLEEREIGITYEEFLEKADYEFELEEPLGKCKCFELLLIDGNYQILLLNENDELIKKQQIRLNKDVKIKFS